ncbi:ATP-binding cassette domain-containing protein [uncultured Bifidobacterium sp.]|uniref:methionine ABC transporter ATP-binding protein n=1 Tax=uncultured Bifidobacterium sp. TaxID=165187 RepID=UPI0028DCA77C|nr:ATP-binding cassette domain-containing protein [uncultured Bifidobacterium sp.]
MSDPIIDMEHVTKEFPRQGRERSRGAVRALEDVSLRIDEGDVFGIIGYSGAGKSTLVRMINALERPTSGSVTVLGTDVTGLSERALRPVRRKIGMIFQQFNLFSTRTVAQNIAYPLRLDHWRRDYQDRRVRELLDFVGLADHADRYPSQLSGGQKQRVGVARALATNPRILLADEATSALDPETTSGVLDLLARVNERFGVTIVLITHQMNVVRQIARRVAVMDSGRIIEQGGVYDVFAAPVHAVTRRFLATAISGLPDAPLLGRLHEEDRGRIVTVMVRQRPAVSATGRAVPASGQHVSRIIAEHGVDGSLLRGGIDTVDGAGIGALTYSLAGDADAVEGTVRALASDGDLIDFGTAADPRPYDLAVSSVAASEHDADAASETVGRDVADASAARTAAEDREA